MKAISCAHTVDLIAFGSVPISLRTGIRADIRGDSQCRDWLDVAGHPGQQHPMPVHRSANLAATGKSAPVAKLVLITQREWVRTREYAVSIRGLLAQWRTLVIARRGRVRKITCADVLGSAIAIWTRDGKGDHPRVRRSCVDVTHGGAARSMSAGRTDRFLSPIIFLFGVFFFPAILFGTISLSLSFRLLPPLPRT